MLLRGYRVREFSPKPGPLCGHPAAAPDLSFELEECGPSPAPRPPRLPPSFTDAVTAGQTWAWRLLPGEVHIVTVSWKE